LARQDFTTKVGDLVAATKLELDKLQHRRPESSQKLGLECSTFESWLLQNVKAVHVQKAGSELWLNNFVALTDYLVNPAVLKKNFLVVNELCLNYIPKLEETPEWLEKLKQKLAAHLTQCYALSEQTRLSS